MEWKGQGADTWSPFKNGNGGITLFTPTSGTYKFTSKGRYLCMLGVNARGSGSWQSRVSVTTTGTKVYEFGKVHTTGDYSAASVVVLIDAEIGDTVKTSGSGDKYYMQIVKVSDNTEVLVTDTRKDMTVSVSLSTLSKSKTYGVLCVGNNTFSLGLPQNINTIVNSQFSYQGICLFTPINDNDNLTFSFNGGNTYGCSLIAIITT